MPFLPRLLVIRVSNDYWQDAVLELANLCDMVLLDLASRSNNLLWELEQVSGRFPGKRVLVGEKAFLTAILHQDSKNGVDELSRVRAVWINKQVIPWSGCDFWSKRRFRKNLNRQLLNFAARRGESLDP